jgi:hypothetical protein
MMVAALLAGTMSGLAQAPQAPAMEQGPDGWKFEITPYLWAAGMEGDVTINGQKADFEKSFSDIVDAVEIGGSLLGVIQYDRFLLWGQADYFELDTDEMDIEDRPQGGRLECEQTLLELAAGYQIDGWMEGQTFDILVGVRSLSMDTDLTVEGHGTRSKEFDVVDPIFVVRPSIPMFPSKIDGLRFNPTLAIGGGGDADLVYELFPQIQYQVNENMAARLGYRTVGYKFKGDNNDNELNFNLAGLIVGLGVTF